MYLIMIQCKEKLFEEGHSGVALKEKGSLKLKYLRRANRVSTCPPIPLPVHCVGLCVLPGRSVIGYKYRKFAEIFGAQGAPVANGKMFDQKTWTPFSKRFNKLVNFFLQVHLKV
jgi:hypothetical protein